MQPFLPGSCEADDTFRFERLLRSRGFAKIAGTDEAGRGPLAGPVVAAPYKNGYLHGATPRPPHTDSLVIAFHGKDGRLTWTKQYRVPKADFSLPLAIRSLPGGQLVLAMAVAGTTRYALVRLAADGAPVP